MSIRIAKRTDISEIQSIRSSVTENVLTSIITEEMIIDVMEKYGRIWIYDLEGQVVGFSAADKRTSNIWALFVLPTCEKRGIGKQLLHEAVQWLWSKGAKTIWLCTDPYTRAEEFYLRQGWTRCGIESDGEIRYELWSKHSRRITPINLSTKGFCQGLRTAIIISSIFLCLFKIGILARHSQGICGDASDQKRADRKNQERRH
jgi:GNAT superfamily N-acetyltransferase